MLVFTPLSGVLADRYGRKMFIIAGFFLLFLVCAGFVFINSLGWEIYALRMLQGAAFSLFFTSAGAVITEIAPEGKRVQAMGIYGMFTIIGYAVAPYVGKIIISSDGFAGLFTFISVVSLAGVFVSFFVRDRFSRRGGEKGGWKILPPFSKPLVVGAIMLFISGWVFMAEFSFVSLSSLSVGVEDFHLFFVCFTAAVLFVRIFLGWIPDKYGIHRVCPPFLFVAFLSVVILAFSRSAFSVAISGALFGAAHGFVYPSLYLLALEKAGDGTRAKVFAVCSASFTFGGMLGTFLSGGIAHTFGYFNMYAALAVVALAGFIFFAFYALFKESKLNAV